MQENVNKLRRKMGNIGQVPNNQVKLSFIIPSDRRKLPKTICRDSKSPRLFNPLAFLQFIIILFLCFAKKKKMPKPVLRLLPSSFWEVAEVDHKSIQSGAAADFTFLYPSLIHS